MLPRGAPGTDGLGFVSSPRAQQVTFAATSANTMPARSTAAATPRQQAMADIDAAVDACVAQSGMTDPQRATQQQRPPSSSDPSNSPSQRVVFKQEDDGVPRLPGVVPLTTTAAASSDIQSSASHSTYHHAAFLHHPRHTVMSPLPMSPSRLAAVAVRSLPGTPIRQITTEGNAADNQPQQGTPHRVLRRRTTQDLLFALLAQTGPAGSPVPFAELDDAALAARPGTPRDLFLRDCPPLTLPGSHNTTRYTDTTMIGSEGPFLHHSVLGMGPGGMSPAVAARDGIARIGSTGHSATAYLGGAPINFSVGKPTASGSLVPTAGATVTSVTRHPTVTGPADVSHGALDADALLAMTPPALSGAFMSHALLRSPRMAPFSPTAALDASWFGAGGLGFEGSSPVAALRYPLPTRVAVGTVVPHPLAHPHPLAYHMPPQPLTPGRHFARGSVADNGVNRTASVMVPLDTLTAAMAPRSGLAAHAPAGPDAYGACDGMTADTSPGDGASWMEGAPQGAATAGHAVVTVAGRVRRMVSQTNSKTTMEQADSMETDATGKRKSPARNNAATTITKTIPVKRARRAAAAAAAQATAAHLAAEREASPETTVTEDPSATSASDDETTDADDAAAARPAKKARKPRQRAAKGAAAGGGKGAGGGAEGETGASPKTKASRTRSSKYRGVTKHRRSGRWEAHIWIKDLNRQVYLGGYEDEDHAAEAYDVAALKTKGPNVKINFHISKYEDLLGCMHSFSLEELIMAVRRQSQGFSRGSSSFRGVTAHPSGRWESRIGVPGSKHVYLGLFEDERSAATAYDRALVRLRGTTAATNFALSDYRRELAEFHQAQQAVLLQDSRIEEVMQGGPEFEKWVKQGSVAFPFMAAAMQAADPSLGDLGLPLPSQSAGTPRTSLRTTHTASGLTAVTRTLTRHKSDAATVVAAAAAAAAAAAGVAGKQAGGVAAAPAAPAAAVTAAGGGSTQLQLARTLSPSSAVAAAAVAAAMAAAAQGATSPRCALPSPLSVRSPRAVVGTNMPTKTEGAQPTKR